MLEANSSTAANTRRKRRARKRELFCPAHPDQLLAGGGKRYYLHLLTAEELRQRGMPTSKAKLVISAYPVLTLSDEWLEEPGPTESPAQSSWCGRAGPVFVGSAPVLWSTPLPVLI